MATALHKNGDVVSGAVLTALGVYVISEARGWGYIGPDGPGPGFFPMWYGIALVVLSIFLMIGAIRKRTAASGGVQWHEVGRALIVWGAFAASVAALKWLGFLLSFALLTAFIATVMYRRSAIYGVAAGVIGAAAFYVIFALGLNVALPVGVLGF
jgi:putative tricarboxylic transport membrane protein